MSNGEELQPKELEEIVGGPEQTDHETIEDAFPTSVNGQITD